MSSHSFWSSSPLENDDSDNVFFDISDYLSFNDVAQEDPPAQLPTRQRRCPVVAGNDAEGGGAGRVRPVDDNDQAPQGGFPVSILACSGRTNVGRNTATGVGVRVAFRTKTELEMLDDGYKWRKYGKKKVKNSPNPRNYYRCSSDGCNVKKRVEREPQDSSYLVTTYDGIHNHHAPPSQ